MDDEESTVALVSEVLRFEGHSADVARDGETALQRMEEKTYDLILLDIRMPGMQGDGVYEEVRRGWPELCPKILFISGNVGDLAVLDFLRRTGNPYPAKPFERTKLPDAVRRTLERQKSET